MVGRDEVLQTVFHPFYGPAQLDHREGHQEVFWIELSANTESPAHIAFNKVHLVLW